MGEIVSKLCLSGLQKPRPRPLLPPKTLPLPPPPHGYRTRGTAAVAAILWHCCVVGGGGCLVSVTGARGKNQLPRSRLFFSRAKNPVRYTTLLRELPTESSRRKPGRETPRAPATASQRRRGAGTGRESVCGRLPGFGCLIFAQCGAQRRTV